MDTDERLFERLRSAGIPHQRIHYIEGSDEPLITPWTGEEPASPTIVKQNSTSSNSDSGDEGFGSLQRVRSYSEPRSSPKPSVSYLSSSSTSSTSSNFSSSPASHSTSTSTITPSTSIPSPPPSPPPYPSTNSSLSRPSLTRTTSNNPKSKKKNLLQLNYHSIS